MVVKIFNETHKATKDSLKKISNAKVLTTDIREIYEKQHKGERATFYRVIPVQ